MAFQHLISPGVQQWAKAIKEMFHSESGSCWPAPKKGTGGNCSCFSSETLAALPKKG